MKKLFLTAVMAILMIVSTVAAQGLNGQRGGNRGGNGGTVDKSADTELQTMITEM